MILDRSFQFDSHDEEGKADGQTDFIDKVQTVSPHGETKDKPGIPSEPDAVSARLVRSTYAAVLRGSSSSSSSSRSNSQPVRSKPQP